MRASFLTTLIGAAALACMVGQARAQSQTVLGTPIVVGSYYEVSFAASFSGSSGGLVASALLPALPIFATPMTVTLTEIGCTTESNVMALTTMFLTVTDDGQNERRRHPVSVPGRVATTSFREPLDFLIVSDTIKKPVIRYTYSNVNGTSGSYSIDLKCTLVGRIAPL